MKTQTKKSLPFLLAALLLASCTQTLPAQTQSKLGWLTSAFKNHWGKIACVAAVASIAYAGYKAYSAWKEQQPYNNVQTLTAAIYHNDVATFEHCLSKATTDDINSFFPLDRSLIDLRCDGITPLTMALYAGNKEFAKQLVQKGAKPNRLFDGRLAFLVVGTVGQNIARDAELMEFLLNYGLNPNYPFFGTSDEGDWDHPTPLLMHCAYVYNKQGIEVLLKHRAKGLTPAQERGLTPLKLQFIHEAAQAHRAKNLAKLKTNNGQQYPRDHLSMIASYSNLKDSTKFSVTSKTNYLASGKQIPQAA